MIEKMNLKKIDERKPLLSALAVSTDEHLFIGLSEPFQIVGKVRLREKNCISNNISRRSSE